MNTLKRIYEEHGYIGINKLAELAKRKGLKVTAKQIKEFIDSQRVSQLHKRARPAISNMIRTYDSHVLYQVDLLDMTKFAGSNKGFKWILICVDIFTRVAAAVPMKDKTAASTLIALKTIFDKMGQPKICASDSGSEFKGVVAKYLKDNKIIQKISEVGDHNSLGIIDRFSQTIKHIIFKSFTHTDTTVWYDKLDKMIKAYNDTVHSSLDNRTPNEADERTSDTLKLLVNKLDQQPQQPQLKVGDIVRIKLKKPLFEKGYTRRYSNLTHKILEKRGDHYLIGPDQYYRINDLQLVPIEDVDEKPDKVKQAHRQRKIETELKADGIEETNLRRGLRERRPRHQLEDEEYGAINY